MAGVPRPILDHSPIVAWTGTGRDGGIQRAATRANNFGTRTVTAGQHHPGCRFVWKFPAPSLGAFQPE